MSGRISFLLSSPGPEPVVTSVLPVGVSGEHAAGRRFVWWLLLATVLPLPLFVVLFRSSSAGASLHQVFTVLFLFSIAHGGLSGLFWFDRRYRTYMASSPGQYYWKIAILAILCLFCVFAFGQRFFDLFSVAYVVWNLFHFSRQNWGVLCLAALGTNTPKPSPLENLAGHFGWVGGAIGVLSYRPTDLAYGEHQLGCIVVLIGLALSLVAACRQIIAKAGLLRVAMTLSIGVFALPIFWLGAIGVTAMGTAHAAQYAIVMTVLARDRQQGPIWFRMAGMLATMLIYLALFVVLNDPGIAGNWVLPAQVASGLIVMWHYMIDAGVWRLREWFQRSAVKESFPFLFAENQSGGK